MKRIYSFMVATILSLIGISAAAETKVVTFDPEVTAGIPEKGTQTINKDGVIIGSSDGVFGTTLHTGCYYRFYKNSTGKITTTEGSIVKVVFTCNTPDSGKKGSGPGHLQVQEGNYETFKEIGTWTGKEKLLHLHFGGGKMFCTKIEVTIDTEGGGGEVVEPEKPEQPTETPKTIGELADEKNNIENVKLTLTNAKVLYMEENTKNNTKSYFVREGDKAILFYDSHLELEVNALLNGSVLIDYKDFYGIPELVENDNTNMDELMVTKTSQEAEPVEATIGDILNGVHKCDLVVIKNVTFTQKEGKKGSQFFINSGEEQLQVYKYGANYEEYVGEGKVYNVIGIFNKIFHGKPQILPVAIEEPAPVEYYPIAIDKDARQTHLGRYVANVELDGQMIDIYTSASRSNLVYRALFDKQFVATAGATVKAKMGYVGEWMHTYCYIDYNQDGQFEVPGKELVSYSYSQGVNSKGETVSAGNTTFDLPEFEIPADLAPGIYRMRYKLDWDNIDPSAGNQIGENNFIANGGTIFDVLLNIHADQVAVAAAQGDGTVTFEDGSALDSKQVAFGEAVRLKVTATNEGQAVKKIVVRHGYNLGGAQVVKDNPQWTEDIINVENGQQTTEVTIPAEYINGDVLLTVEYGAATGLDQVLEDGKLVEIYNLKGQKVTSTKKGEVYIINGKKVMK